MSTPDELFIAAKSIYSNATDQAMYRAAISRLYYAAYHRSYGYHFTLPVPGTVGSKNGVHAQLINQLKNPDGKLPAEIRCQSVAIGKSLDRLFFERVRADYRCADEIKDIDMQTSLDHAQAIFENSSIE